MVYVTVLGIRKIPLMGEYSIPQEVNQEAILLLKVSRTWNPQKTLGTPDPRNLGVAIGEIRFKDNI